MRYEIMLPPQIRTAIDEAWPVILSSGMLEYHAGQRAVGTDALIINKIVDELEKEIDMVVLPPLFYGVSSHAVAPTGRNGMVNISAETLHLFGRDLFRGLLRVGFKNIRILPDDSHMEHAFSGPGNDFPDSAVQSMERRGRRRTLRPPEPRRRNKRRKEISQN